MKEKRLDDVAGEFRKTIDDALKEIGDIRDELPAELKSAKTRIDKLEKTMQKQKSMLERFISSK